MSTKKIVIREALKSDIKSIVNIHKNAFKDFFLTSLGTDFLSFYYSRILSYPDAYIVCALEDDCLIGFAAMAENSKGFNGKLVRKNFVSFMFLAIKMLFTSPNSLIRLIKNLSKKPAFVDDPEDYAELFSIGVLGSAQGKGVGKLLLSASEDYIRGKSVSKMSLTTDYYDNDKTVLFYKSMGYDVLYEFVTYPNRKMYRFIKTL